MSLALLDAIKSREITLLRNATFLAAIYVDSRYQLLLKYSQKTVVPAYLAALWRRLQMLHESTDPTDVEYLDSSSESKSGSAKCGADIIDEILATSDACNASSSQSPRDEQIVTETIKCFHDQARLLRNTNIFEWSDKQAGSNFKRVANAGLALPVTQGSVERAFSGLRYILN